MKRILIISGWAVMISGAMVLLGFAKSSKNNTPCKSVDVTISGGEEGMFITPSEIDSLIVKEQGEMKGKNMSKINLLQIEQMLKDNPYITDAKVYATLDGDVKIKVSQKTPVARIINSNDESYYVDSGGCLMPLSENYVPRLLVVNGYINETYSENYRNNLKNMEKDTYMHSPLPGIYLIASFINKNPFWKAMVTQLYVDSAKEFTLIPRVGNQRILLGDTTNLKQKFDKLFELYKEGFSSNGKWNEYSSINLKYKHQIICTKK